MEFKVQIGKQYSIQQYIIFSIVVGIIISCLSGPLNNLLKKHGKQINSYTCSHVWHFSDENIQRILYQLCILTKKDKLDDDDIYGFLDGLQKAVHSPVNDLFAQDERIREQRIHYATGYAIDSYINKLEVKPFVRYDKPKGYFEDVYTPNKYNEEQKVLLEQAQYTEFPSNHSKAQEVLGPARELKYVGLQFPYGIDLKKTTEDN